MSEKTERVVDARMRLRERFLKRIAGTPGMADDQPQGTGPRNRHGMPKLPVGQHETRTWPVLDLGTKPDVPTATWRLTVDGACASPLELSYADLLALPQVDDVSDFHCVTAWSRFDVPWRGVQFSELMARAMPDADAAFVMCHGYDGYTTNVPLVEAMKPDVLIAHHVDGGPLPVAHGGPVRMITPQLYAWKGAKWIKLIELMTEDRLGFWERNGYSNTAHPWRNDRYAGR